MLMLKKFNAFTHKFNLKRDLSQKAFAAETYLHLAVKLSSVWRLFAATIQLKCLITVNM